MHTGLAFLILTCGLLSPQEGSPTPGNVAWKGLDKHWSVRQDCIYGTTQSKGIDFNTFLCSQKEFRDFEVSLKANIVNGKGNSGIQIRSKIIDQKKFVVAGPQCDMGQQYWGSLYGEQFGGMMKASDPETVKKVIKTNDFNDYYILCQGKRVVIKINGTTMLDGSFDKLPDSGIIALQIHGGGPMDVIFKDIVIKELK